MRNPLMLVVGMLGALLALAIVVFVLANRTEMEVSLFPYPRVVMAPVFLVVLVSFAAGALFGGLFVWMRGHPSRRLSGERKRRVKHLETNLASVTRERDTLKSELDRQPQRSPPVPV
ncbi:MAG: LapA family protein [bacterium]|nr:LapA family protein [bacterium]